jgi:putative two-component system response regulator
MTAVPPISSASSVPRPAVPTAGDFVLIVDDEPTVRQTLARGLMTVGYQCITAVDGRDALARLEQGRFAVMLCDVRMPGMDGLELLGHAVARDPDMPVVMVTALAGVQTAVSALRAGAYDYITKPFTFTEVELTVARALEYRRLRLQNRQYVEHLEELVEQRARQVREIAVGVLTSLGFALEAKDEWTHSHSRRVADLSAHLGRELGLTMDQCSDLRLAGMLHDIGKIGVREAVLHKDGRLTEAEYAHIKVHPDLGARILSPLQELDRIVPFIRHHHERWDGGGYPDHLAGDDIPYGARIVCVADAYVAMREHRPYRRPMPLDQVLGEVRNGNRRQFDFDVAGALMTLHQNGTLERLDAAYVEPPRDLHPAGGSSTAPHGISA